MKKDRTPFYYVTQTTFEKMLDRIPHEACIQGHNKIFFTLDGLLMGKIEHSTQAIAKWHLCKKYYAIYQPFTQASFL